MTTIQEKHIGKQATDGKTAAGGSEHEFVDLGLSVKWATVNVIKGRFSD